jgi:hypothetical protein
MKNSRAHHQQRMMLEEFFESVEKGDAFYWLTMSISPSNLRSMTNAEIDKYLERVVYY